MGAFEKYSRALNFPTYEVEYAKYKDYMDGNEYPLTWVGAYEPEKSKYGRECYVDILKDNKHIRVNLPKYMVDDCDKIAHDAEAMKQITDNIMYVKFTPYKTKSGNETCNVVWIEKELPF